MAKARYKDELRFVINLTKTTRYYEAEEFGNDVHTQQIQCAGHGERPTPEQVKVFIHVCKTFWQKQPGCTIGVHCTHGFNRTGFMICCYLIEEMDCAVEDALQLFAKSRDPGIYKPDYVEDLLQRYHGDAPELIPRTRPAWCAPNGPARAALQDAIDALHLKNAADITPEVVQAVNEGCLRALEENKISEEPLPLEPALEKLNFADSFVKISDPQTVVEALKQVLADAPAAESPSAAEPPDHTASNDESEQALPSPCQFSLSAVATTVVSAPHLGPLRRKVRTLVGAQEGTAFPGSQPVSLNRDSLLDLSRADYMISWKSDGTRYLMLLADQKVYFVGRDNNYFCVAGKVRFPNQDLKSVHQNTLLDGEMVYDCWKDPATKKKQYRARFYIFDMIACNGESFRHKPYNERLEAVQTHILNPRLKQSTWPGYKEKYAQEPFSVRLKPFLPLADFQSDQWRKMRSQVQHKDDGLLLVRVAHEYKAGSCKALLKWKPAHLNTIDFRLKVEDIGDRTVGTLYVQDVRGRGSERPEVKFTGMGSPELNTFVPQERQQLWAYDGKIVECNWLSDLNRWNILLERKDKTHPNAFHTAINVVGSIRDGIELRELEDVADRKRQERAKRGHVQVHHQQAGMPAKRSKPDGSA
ncbi:uncharacterized protein MONBRDRAFT_29192 [Monosiga brevicollis MX1]|uniref:mRNA guanylyltransferase n=1 Tax=Monosiga brevicollis TaxID=81824 RepID=A9VAD7_MONBE|nr:uncharacterized protein MONBRDRAFT_29192 [Monosiga brevicollis MX1]EDQ85467.1 predicted protein [Monosiga brevicollis MX1]|eukprot:XP_001749658.1 hypothetical protein [Monosiga brevicollis MX1]